MPQPTGPLAGQVTTAAAEGSTVTASVDRLLLSANQPAAMFRARNTPGAMKITAADEVTDVVRERGGRLYVWTSSHRCCSGALTLLETGTERPTDPERRFHQIDAGAFDLMLDLGARRAPQELVLELRGRRKKIAAFWNDQAWVG